MSDEALRELERGWRRSRDPELGRAWVRGLERAGSPRQQVLRAQAETEDQSGYMEAVTALPRPTAQQIADWARFVSCCHSWYKHLRYTPAHRFVFFLAPRPDAYEGGGHYASHPVAFHVEHYGHFEYTELRPEKPPRGEVSRVPSTLIEAGTALVTAAMHPEAHPRLPPHTVSWNGVEAYEARLIQESRSRGLLSRLRGALRAPSDREVRALWDEHLPRERARQLRLMEDAMHAVAGIVWGPDPAPQRPAGRYPWFGSGGRSWLDRRLPQERIPRPPEQPAHSPSMDEDPRRE